MTSRPHVRAALLACLAAGTAAACSGSDGVASPGEGVFVTSPPASPPASPPTSPPASPPTSPPTSGPAASCPTGTTSVGTIATTTGTLRNCVLPTRILGSSLELNDVAGVIYSLSGRTDVGDDRGADPAAPIAGRQAGTLIVNEGVTIFGSTSSDYLVVNRGSQIFVNGSPTNPVVFTGRQDVIGSATAGTDQQWGGVIVLGRAPINNCPAGAVAPTLAAPNIACEAQIEGADFALFGGATHNDNSGSISYAQIKFGGIEIGAGNEINGLTMGGVGAATTVSNVQVHYNFDDGIELFGGRVNLSNIVLTSIGDDSLDLDFGWTGAAQNVLVVQEAGRGDHGFEFGDADAQPLFTHSKISNATIISTGDDAINVKEEHLMDLYNSVLVRSAASESCIDNDNAGVNNPTFNSVVLTCGTNFASGAGDTGAAFTAGANNNTAFTSSLTNTFVNGANENGVTVTAPVNHPFGSGVPASSFLTTPGNIGAVNAGNATWYQGWTCGLPGEAAC